MQILLLEIYPKHSPNDSNSSFSNILDTKQLEDLTNPTRVSEIRIFHTQGQSNIPSFR